MRPNRIRTMLNIYALFQLMIKVPPYFGQWFFGMWYFEHSGIVTTVRDSGSGQFLMPIQSTPPPLLGLLKKRLYVKKDHIDEPEKGYVGAQYWGYDCI